MNTSPNLRSHWSVRTFVNCLVMACLLPGVFGAAILIIHQYREGRAQQEKDTIRTARALVQAADYHLLRGLALAQALSTADALIDGDFARFHGRATTVIALVELGSHVVVRDAAGQRLVDTRVGLGEPLSTTPEPEQVRNVFQTGRPSFSSVVHQGQAKQLVMSVDVPVYMQGRIRYVLSVGILPEHFNVLLKSQGLPAGWIAAVLDSSATIVGRNQTPEQFVGALATAPMRAALPKAPEGSVKALSQEGTPVYSFYSCSPDTHWCVAIGIPRQDLQRELVQRLALLGAGVSALFGIALLLAWSIGGRIAGSVTALLGPARALGGDGEAKPTRVYIKEAAQVGKAILWAAEMLKQRSAELGLREKELTEAYRLARFGAWFWDLKTGTVEVSDSIREIYGRDIPSFNEQRGTLLSEDAWQKLLVASRQVMLGEEDGFDLEIEVNHGAGHVIWVNIRSEAVFNETGERVALRGTIQDITVRKQQDEALRQSEAHAQEAARLAVAERRRLDAVLEATPVGIAVADADGHVILANLANRQLWGSEHPMPDGMEAYLDWKGWWADGSERHGQRLQAQDWGMARALRGEEPLPDIIEIESFDQPPVRRIVLLSAAVVRDDEGRIVGGVVAQMDITDRIRAEEALKQASRRKDEFLAMLAHELRNPLAPIAAAAELLGLDRLDAARVKQTSTVIARQVRHMTGLVDDLLDISRVTRGLVTLDMRTLDVRRIIADAVEQVRPLLEARHHQLLVHAPADPAFVMGDQKRLVQIMANLLNNAAKFTPDGGELRLNVEHAGGQICISLIDNGIGMGADLAGRAFELFTQGERTPDRSQGGLGIGLALVKSLVDLHGGSVTAFSEGLGRGSCFSICLPYQQDKSWDAGHDTAAVSVLVSAHALSVLIVDDNEDAAQMLALFVEALGHQVVVAHSSHSALQRATHQAFDVCLLDIGLPEMDGIELARQLRMHSASRNALLVAISGYGQEQDRQKALAGGFDVYFVKPVDTGALEQVLNERISTQGAGPE